MVCTLRKRTIILGNYTTGIGAVVVGAGAVVTKIVPDYAVAAGFPAGTLHYR